MTEADFGWVGRHTKYTEHHESIATIEMGARQHVPTNGIGPSAKFRAFIESINETYAGTSNFVPINIYVDYASRYYQKLTALE